MKDPSLMRQVWALVCTIGILLTTSLSASSRPGPAGPGLSVQHKSSIKRTSPIFVFHTDEFWLNLHHFLYVLGRAQNKERDTAREAVAGAPDDQARGLTRLTPKERAIWHDAVNSYAMGLSRKDIVFNDPLPAITKSLVNAGKSHSLTAMSIDPTTSAILARVASIYRKAWWANHHQANRAWQKSIQTLVDRYGVNVLSFITGAYQLEWPAAGFDVHVSAYANWAGAYSTDGNLLVLSSLSSGLQGEYGFETVFHEGMHQWDDQVFAALREQARKLHLLTPRDLSHAMIFFTAGEAVRSVLPGHLPYADKFGVWERGLKPFKVVLDEVWKPYLAGHGTRDEALTALIQRTGIEPKKTSYRDSANRPLIAK